VIKELSKSLLPSRAWTSLRIARIKWGITHYQAREVTHLYGGNPLRIHLADPMAQGWYDHDWPELNEILLLKRSRLKPGARVFDIGAHQCIVALMLAKAVEPGGVVIALEASPHNAAVGLRNQRLNEIENMHIVNAAVAETSGRLTFNKSLNGQVDDGTGGWGTLEVDAFTVDALSHKYGFPDVLFIDVEGFELQALRGAQETLARHPDCFVEVHVGAGLEKFGGCAEAVISFFPRSEYDLFVASEGQSEFVPLGPDTELLLKRFFLLAIGRRPPTEPRSA
jgi:FkbM family methyltransferase